MGSDDSQESADRRWTNDVRTRVAGWWRGERHRREVTRIVADRLPASVRESYWRKFLFGLVLVACLTGLIGLYTYVSVGGAVTTDTNDELTAVASAKATELDQWRDQRELLTAMLSNSEAMRDGDLGTIRPELNAKLTQFPADVHNIHYVNATTDEIVASTSPMFAGQTVDPAETPWAARDFSFKNISSVYTSPPHRGQTGESVVAFVSPVPQSDKVIVLTTATKAMADRLRTSVTDGRTMVVNGDGTVVFDQADTATLSRYGNGSSRAATVTAGLAGETGVSTSGTAATERGRIVAYTPVDGTGWTLLVRTPAESAYALRALVSDRLVLLLGTAILGLACVGVVLGRNTARTLEELAANARSIARGETDVTVEETARQDEVGEMVESFARTQSYLATVEAQADALARQDFDAPVLEETVPGDIGTSLDAMAADLEALIEDIEQARAEAEQSRAAAAEINQELEAEAERLGAAMERAADGDLTQRLDAETDHESMRAITTAFNGMLDELETTVDTIQAFADEVASTSGAVAERSEELRTRSQRVSDAVEGIATDATSQTADLERANAELDELSATVQEVAASADEVASVSAAAASRGTEGKEQATAALERMDRIEDRTEEAVREIERLAEEMADIVSVVDLIDDIAAQTNILALNASIEAARAGEAGEGFAVVADEVKSLAEETQAATEEIETRIARVESTTESAVDDITATGELVAEGAETIESSLTALEEIGDAVARANEGVQSIDGATDEQAASSQEVVTMVDRVTEIGQRTATEATDVAETTQQQAVDVDDITDRVQSLSGRAEELRAEVERFETGSRVPDTAPDPSVDGEHAEPASVRTADPEPTSDD